MTRLRTRAEGTGWNPSIQGAQVHTEDESKGQNSTRGQRRRGAALGWWQRCANLLFAAGTLFILAAPIGAQGRPLTRSFAQTELATLLRRVNPPALLTYGTGTASPGASSPELFLGAVNVNLECQRRC